MAGTPLLFSLEDTVTAGSEDAGCTEYLCYRDSLVRLARDHGLTPVEMESLADARASGRHKRPRVLALLASNKTKPNANI